MKFIVAFLAMLALLSPVGGMRVKFHQWNLPNCAGIYIMCKPFPPFYCCGLSWSWMHSAIVEKNTHDNMSIYRGGYCHTFIRGIQSRAIAMCVRAPNGFSGMIWAGPGIGSRDSNETSPIEHGSACAERAEEDPYFAIGELGYPGGPVFDLANVTRAEKEQFMQLYVNATDPEDVPRKLFKYRIETPEHSKRDYADAEMVDVLE